jgi:replicative DNA helicase
VPSLEGRVSKAPDVNDRHMAGELPADPMAKVKPINGAAERALADQPRVLTVRQILEASAERAKSANKIATCTTGHYIVDDATGGIAPGDSWLFGAESSWGKSTWLVAVIDENLLAGKRCLIVTAEDSERIYGNRLLARRSGVAAKRIRSQRLDAWDDEQIEGVIRNAEAMPVFLDARDKTAEWTAKQVDKLLVSENIDLVAYDYVQEFSAARPQENHRLTLKYIAKTLRMPPKLRNKASILFTQLTASESTRKSAHPTKDNVRDCKDIANAAETILLGYTPDVAIEANDQILVAAGQKAIWIEKVKEGPAKFAVGQEWDDSTAAFVRVDDPNKPNERHYSEREDYQDGLR